MGAEPYYCQEMTDSQRREIDEILDRIASDGGLYQTDRDGRLLLDAAGSPSPLEYVVCRSRRFLVDSEGTVWKFFAEGTKKNPDAPDGGGAPWRNNRIEMWTGGWRRIVGADGEVDYVKTLTARPVDKRINGHPGLSQIQWYRTVKGYKHPQDPPNTPTADQVRAMEHKRSAVAAELGGRMDAALSAVGAQTKPEAAAAEESSG